MIYDISVGIHNGMHVWPGDPAVRLEASEAPSRDGSHTVRLTAIHFGSHTGTHLDAASHMMSDGVTLSDIPLEQLVGPCRLMELPSRRSIDRASLERLEWRGVERVLFKTDNSRHWTDPVFNEDFVYLEPEAAGFLAESNLRLVGIDYLSIDRYGSASHASHHALLARSIVILEGLDLSKTPAGDYQLVALPLKLERADGAPVRAILIR